MSTDNSVSVASRTFWFISTPAVISGGLPCSRMIHPFETEEEAVNGAELLNNRFPGPQKAYVGQLTYKGERPAEDMEQAFRVARGDLADELAGPDPRRAE
ncbi:hypothetical protein [Pseudomonas fluorescens]|uniref:Uncharacterized protein n=1 Tax=Pseudomonas fluorescens TaxID=294 RepID=A0A2T0HLS5_PSEFL|nr:hypothetical protein [Pseudomonas fluorescens]PRW84034.1 hypothetical protein C7A10_29630 [Pseudomonas fluorescens]